MFIIQIKWELLKRCFNVTHKIMCFGNLVTMMNRLGHCENNTFGTELEDAISVKVSSKSSVLTKQIVKGTQNRVFHSEWDNFNQMWRTVHRQPMRYFAGGICCKK